MHIFLLFYLLCIIQGLVASSIASKKGYNAHLWFAAGLVCGVFGILGAYFLQPKRKRRTTARKEPLPPTLPHRMWYYLDDAHEQKGPVSSSALLALLVDRKIVHSSYVWHEEMEAWESLEKATSCLGFPLVP